MNYPKKYIEKLNQDINGNTSLRYLEFRENAFDFQTSQQNHN